MPPKAQPKFKAKILFLHGYTQTASIFYAKTSALRKRLQKLEYKSVYLNGPSKLTPADLPSSDALASFNSVVSTTEDSEETNNRGWWVKPNDNNEGIDIESAIETVRNYVKKGEIIPDADSKVEEESEEERKLPIAGIVGFSQGACLGGLISHKFDEIFDTEPLKFVVLYSGFKVDTSKASHNDRYADFYPDPNRPNDKFKYLHVYGELDTVVGDDRAFTFYDITKGNSDLLKHPGGHFVPNSRLSIDQVTNWIQTVDKEKEEPSKEQEKKEDDIDALLDMMDNFGKA